MTVPKRTTSPSQSIPDLPSSSIPSLAALVASVASVAEVHKSAEYQARPTSPASPASLVLPASPGSPAACCSEEDEKEDLDFVGSDSGMVFVAKSRVEQDIWDWVFIADEDETIAGDPDFGFASDPIASRTSAATTNTFEDWEEWEKRKENRNLRRNCKEFLLRRAAKRGKVMG